MVGFASILTMDQDAASKKKKSHMKGKGKKRLQVATMDGPMYPLVKVLCPGTPTCRRWQLALRHQCRPALVPLRQSMLPLVGTLTIFKATLESPFVAPKDKAQVTEVGDYWAKRLATIAALVDKSMPVVAALFDAIPRGKGGRWRGPGKTLLFDIGKTLVVPEGTRITTMMRENLQQHALEGGWP